MQNNIIEEVTITQSEYNTIFDIQERILSMLGAQGDPTDILEELCRMAESLLPNSVASIMFLDSKTGLISVIAAPSVPQEGHDALTNLTPGTGGGSCGNAIFLNTPQYVQDTYTDPRWSDLRHVADDFNLCSCWSTPVQNTNNQAIGTFALSSFEHRSPAPFHKKLLEIAASIVSIVLKNQAIQKEIDTMAYTDLLTGLSNKTSLEKAIKTSDKQTLILLNVNNFSYINTAYGFEIGDKILIQLSRILRGNCEAYIIARINSDEFALLFDTQVAIESKIQEVQEYFLTNQVKVNDIYLNISFSYGASDENENLLRNAALALKQAKINGKNRYYIYSNAKDATSPKTRELFITLNNQLHRALIEKRITPYFQGIRDNSTKKIAKYEALARIEEDGKIISPYVFLEPARLSGMLPEITKIMIDKSFKVMSENDYIFSINITEEDLSLDYLLDYLKEKCQEYHIESSRVILEILEGISSKGKKNHTTQLKAIKSLGFKLAIDDFGTEYSNFERVLDLEIDYLKIDAKYIKDIHTNKKSYEITRAIVFFAKNANISCIAEFVHNQEVQNIVEELGINCSQGYLFSEPSPTLGG